MLCSVVSNSTTEPTIHWVSAGRVAQWIRRLTTDQAIPGSSPGTVV